MRRIVTTLLIAASGVGCTVKHMPGTVEQSEGPTAVAESKAPAAEKVQPKPPQEPIKEPARVDLSAALATFAPGWLSKDCGAEPGGTGSMQPGIRDELGKKNVLVTHPLSATEPCVLGRRADILPDKKTTLHLVVGHHPEGEWLLSVTADHELVHKVIDKETAPDGWTNVDVDLSSYAGQNITLQLINASNGKPNAAGYWAKIEME